MSNLRHLLPQRIVCLAAEAPEILDRLGVFDRIVGVTSFARRPGTVRNLPRVGGFSTSDVDAILALEPDLVIATSDVQADVSADLIRRGLTVLTLNPHRLVDLWRSILLLGGMVGKPAAADALAAEMQRELTTLKASAADLPRRPRVFFEEWPEPLVSGVGWVGDLIEIAGGEDIFPDLRSAVKSEGRQVTPEAVIAAQPDVILASWCGKPADLAALKARPGWDAIPAVQNGHVYEVRSEDVLQVGPQLLSGAHQIADHIRAAAQNG